ncbi:MAG: Hsp20/alpha crystallin family protein [Patescibacteria group bacterium]
MPKDKRSFFEKLTGSISVDHDRSETEPTQSEEINKSDNFEDDPEEGGELAVDVYQTTNDIIIQTMIAGVRPSDVDISIAREMVTIRGQRERTNTSSYDDYFHQELYWGNFSRSIVLPAEVETEEAEASEKHGLLTIKLPKIDKNKVQQLKIKTND